jgi:transcriptional regulator with XRE-family HTH domain
MKKTTCLTDVYAGHRVRMRRLMLDMSQTELANALGVTFQQIQKYEKGINRMGASRLLQIADTLSVSVSFFFEGAERSASRDVQALSFGSQYTSSTDVLKLAKTFLRLKNARTRRRVVNLVEEIASNYPEDT